MYPILNLILSKNLAVPLGPNIIVSNAAFDSNIVSIYPNNPQILGVASLVRKIALDGLSLTWLFFIKR